LKIAIFTEKPMMETVLQVRHQAITVNDVIPLLTRYQMLPQLLEEIVIDQAIESYFCTAEEQAMIADSFFAQQQVASLAGRVAWLEAHQMTLEEATAPLQRQARIEKFKRAVWGHRLESYFLKRKDDLDQVVCSIIRHPDREMVQELYFRLQEQEQSFAELAHDYSEGIEAQSYGIMGPIEFGQLHPALAQLLRASQPHQLMKSQIENWYVLVQVEAKIPAQFDQAMQQRLLDELFAEWLQAEIAAVV
jgi:parvulin-like peptidyl-prolyl isomerase